MGVVVDFRSRIEEPVRDVLSLEPPEPSKENPSPMQLKQSEEVLALKASAFLLQLMETGDIVARSTHRLAREDEAELVKSIGLFADQQFGRLMETWEEQFHILRSAQNKK